MAGIYEKRYSDKISPYVQTMLRNVEPGNYLPIVIRLHDTLSEHWPGDHLSQDQIRAMMDEDRKRVEHFAYHLEHDFTPQEVTLVSSMPSLATVALHATPEVIQRLAENEDVASIIENQPVSLIEPVS
jgi:hypothetical protein